MAQYDPRIIHDHAQRLYNRALVITSVYGLGFGVLGLIGGAAFAPFSARGADTLTAILGGLMFSLMGVAVGRSRGFELRLQAQVALCQVQIEHNGRAQAPQMHPHPTQPMR